MTVHPRALDHPQSFLSAVIPDEAELTAGQRIEPGRSYGFFYRHDIVHWVQGLRGRLQGMERPPGRRSGAARHQLRTIPATSRRRPGGMFILSSTSPQMAIARPKWRPSRAIG